MKQRENIKIETLGFDFPPALAVRKQTGKVMKEQENIKIRKPDFDFPSSERRRLPC